MPVLVYAGWTAVGSYAANFLYIMVMINVGLAVFNLLPISPLDGSKILYAVLPNKIYYKLYRYEAYFQIGLIVLLFLGACNNLLYTLQVDMLSLIVDSSARVLSVLGLL